jgi:brefeldin A-inhibited guanine nucleotide-exchange protein
MVNGLLKTAQGIPPGADSSLNPVQDAALKLAAIKCLVGVLRSMGDWMNRQLPLVESSSYLKSNSGEESTSDTASTASLPAPGADSGEETIEVTSTSESHPPEETSEAATFEQRRVYKLEMQVTVYPYHFGYCALAFS